MDSCRILKGENRTEGDDVWDDATGNYTSGPDRVLFEGDCQISAASRLPQTSTIGGIPVTELEYVVKISLGAVLTDDLMPDDIIECTAVHGNGDPLLIGKMFIVRSIGMQTYSVLRPLGCVMFVPRPSG